MRNLNISRISLGVIWENRELKKFNISESHIRNWNRQFHGKSLKGILSLVN